MRLLLLLFIVLPIVEMLLLFEVSGYIGALNTVMLVVLTAVIGVQVLRRQGWSTFSRANERLRRGEIPAQEMIEGLFLAVGGAFLLTPGFITDTLGFLLLIGPTRRMLVRALLRSGKLAVYGRGWDGGFTWTSHSHWRDDEGRDVYEGEYTEEKPSKRRLKE